MNDVNQRKLLHALTPDQENTLKKQGASNSLVQSLRGSNLVVSKEEAAAVEAQPEKQAARTRKDSSDWDASENVRIFDVALGRPINLSQWGGSHLEFAFYTYRCAGEDIVEAVSVDPIGTFTEMSRSTAGYDDAVFAADSYRGQRFMPFDDDGHRFTPYDFHRDLKDARFNSGYIGVTARSYSRPYPIDWANPVTISGVPYQLYPVYARNGVSLYFISASSTSVRLAVSTTGM